jgi:asparagine synthetase B (glutamine-hydrolysing)
MDPTFTSYKEKMVPEIGDFSVFGFTKDPERFLAHFLPDRLNINPRKIEFGNAGTFFLYSSYGEIAETDEAVLLKLGFLRSPGRSPLSASQLLNHKVVSPDFIDNDEVRGNALVVCLSKTDLKFSAFKTVLGVPQLYYANTENEIIFSDRLVCIVKLLEKAELNEDLIPMHFLFRSIPGDLTYYRQIKRILPGQFIRWSEGELTVKIAENLDFSTGNFPLQTQDSGTQESVYDTLKSILDDYIDQVEISGQSVVNLLSGGVDSSLLQFLTNQHASHSSLPSFSFAIRVPSFQQEIDYAGQASQLFQTHHTFVEFSPEDYPGLLSRAIDQLAQPPILATEPSMLSIAEFAHQKGISARYFVSGQGADTVFGLTYSRKMKLLNYVRKIPGAAQILGGVGFIMKPIGSLSKLLLKGAAILSASGNPDSFMSPLNSIAVYCDLEVIRRCFGDEAIRKAFEYRRDFVAGYKNSEHYLEQFHVMDLMTDTYELGVQRQQLFLAHRKEQLHPFFDDDVLRAGFAFSPDTRYIKGLRSKYLLKDILALKTGSPAAKKPKGFSVFENDLFDWMVSGPLQSSVHEIKLPGFMSKVDFDKSLNTPDYFLWELLMIDLFQRRCLA